MDIEWRGEGRYEKGVDSETGRVLIEVDPRYFRPTEVDLLLGDPSKAERLLGWKRKVSFDELVRRMVEFDMRLVEKNQSMLDAGFDVALSLEDR
jgi:GDPmannose 4,6-dehydratase